MEMSIWIGLAALALSLPAIMLATWQVVRQEQSLARRAWHVLRLDHNEVAPGRRGIEIELSISGPSVLFEVDPFTHGGMTLHAMSEPTARVDCTTPPIRLVADIVLTDDTDSDSWFGVIWRTSRRSGRTHVEEALRVHLRTGQIQHWLWSRRLVPLTWRHRPSGRWGVRKHWLGKPQYDIPGLDESFLREREREAQQRRLVTWPPRRH